MRAFTLTNWSVVEIAPKNSNSGGLLHVAGFCVKDSSIKVSSHLIDFCCHESGLFSVVTKNNTLYVLDANHTKVVDPRIEQFIYEENALSNRDVQIINITDDLLKLIGVSTTE